MIKAIETRYKGYRFRSRLEARWAVFFDALGLDWEYEPEGFDLGEAGWYLPDFRITGKDTNGDEMEYWFEIKPKGKPLSDIESAKIKAFGKQWKPPYAGAFLLCQGMPGEKRTVYIDQCSGMEYILWSHRARPWFAHPDRYIEPEYRVNSRSFEEMLFLDSVHTHYHMNHKPGAHWLLDYWDAKDKAYGARFEHGECG